MRIVLVLALAAALSSPAAAAGPAPDDSLPLPTIARLSSSSHVDPRMSAAVSKLAGKPALVRCLSASDWAALADQVGGGPFGDSYRVSGAWTTFATSRVSMSPDLCGLVGRFTYQGYFPYSPYSKASLAEAITILAHEAANVTFDHPNAAVAECDAQQWMAPLVRLLKPKVKPSTARLLASLAWTKRYPRLPDNYRSTDCRDGGPLDVNPGSSVWP